MSSEWVLVPREPTEAMMRAAQEAEYLPNWQVAKAIWSAMVITALSAAENKVDGSELGLMEQYGPLVIQRVQPTPEQRRLAWGSEIYRRGDTALVLVNEGDLDMLSLAAAPSPDRAESVGLPSREVESLIADIGREMAGVKRGYADKRGELLFRCRAALLEGGRADG